MQSQTTVYAQDRLVIQAENKLDEPIFLTGMCEKKQRSK